MARVLVTGGAGTIGAAVVRRLMRDPDWEIRIADEREIPAWMRTGTGSAGASTGDGWEAHTGDLRELAEARAASAGCTHVIHLAAIVGGIGNFHRYPHTLLEANTALFNSVFRAALEQSVERLVYVSSSMVFERATEFPTTEAHIRDTGIPDSAYGFSKLAGEVYCRALADEHGLPYTICRPFNAYGPGEHPDDEPGIAHMVPDLIKKVLDGQRPLQIFGSGEQTRTLTHVDDIAEGIVTAMGHPAGAGEDFNISASEELTVAQIARLIWEACGQPPDEFELEHLPSFQVDVPRRWPSVEKARELIGFEARVPLREGLAGTVEWLREQRAAAASS
jgi:UDP-glucose 4-epimerase